MSVLRAAMLAALVAAWPAPGAAHDVALPAHGVLAWDCWVDTSDDVTKVRCILDLDAVGHGADEDDAVHIVLHQIHDMIHGGDDVRDLNRMVGNAWHVLREGDVWTIRIFRPPGDDSWSEGRPQLLVRTLLCPPSSGCQVTFKDHPRR